MTDAPKLTLVDRAMQGVDPLVSQAADRKVLTRYIGSISKTCYAEERRRVFNEIGAKSIEEFAQVPILRAERDARVTSSEMDHAKKAARNFGVILGMAGGAALTVLVGSSLLLAGSRASVAGFTVGSMLGANEGNDQRLRQIERGEAPRSCVPGQTLDDGRICGAQP